MANESDKRLLLRLELDTEKFRTVREAIVELTGMVKELARELNSIGGGNRGQLSLFGGMDTNSRDKIPIPRAGDTGSGMAGAGGGINGVASGVAGMASGLKSITSDAIQSLKAMTNEVKSAVDNQSQALSRLKNNFQEVKGQLDLFNPPSVSGQQLSLFGSSPAGRPGVSRRAGLPGDGGLFQVNEQSINSPGFATPFTNAANNLPIDGSRMLGSLGGIALSTLPLMAIRAFSQQPIEYANEALALGMDPLRRGAMAGSSLGNVALSMRGGRNLAAIDAFARLGSGGGLNSAVLGADREATERSVDTTDPAVIAHRKKAYDRMRLVAHMDAQGNIPSTLEAAGDADNRRTLANAPDSWVRNFGGKTKDLVTDEVEHQVRRGVGDMSINDRQAAAAAIEAEVAANVQRTAMFNFFSQNAAGGLMRMAVSGRRPNRDTKKVQSLTTPLFSQYDTFESDSTVGIGKHSPFSDDAIAQGEGALGALAGRGLRGNAKSLMEYELAGLTGANQTFANAAQYGKNGMNFIRAISEASGSGGGLIDATASSRLGSYISQTLTTGIGDMDGIAALKGAQGIVSGLSDSVGDNIRNARQFTAGADIYNKDISRGGLDPLQQAINHHASFGLGGTMYGRLALERLSPIELSQIIRNSSNPGFTLPRTLTAEGVSTQDVVKYAEEQSSFALARYSRTMGGASPAAQAAAGARSAGINQYLLGKLKEGKGTFKESFDDLATALGSAQGNKYSHQDYRGELMQIANQDPTLAKFIKGGGIGLVTKNTVEQQDKDTKTESDQARMKEVRDNIDSISTAMKKANPLAEDLLTITKNLDVSGRKFVEAMNAAATAIYERLIPAINGKKPNTVGQRKE
jgi:methyl-accepting chemotaxis protein